MLRFAKGSTAIDITGPGAGAGRRSVVIGHGGGPRWVCRQLSISDLYAYTLLPARCMWRCTGRASSVSHRRAVRTPRPRYAATSFQESRRSPVGVIIVTYAKKRQRVPLVSWPRMTLAGSARGSYELPRVCSARTRDREDARGSHWRGGSPLA